MRTTKIISKKTFYEQLKKILSDDDICFQDLVNDDLKVEFDFENSDLYNFQESDIIEDCGLTYCLFSAGGDWENPVSFAVYFDTKNKLRVYIPTEGNPYNISTKMAYGNSYNDVLDFIKRCNKAGIPVDKKLELEDADIDSANVQLLYNKESMQKEIRHHIHNVSYKEITKSNSGIKYEFYLEITKNNKMENMIISVDSKELGFKRVNKIAETQKCKLLKVVSTQIINQEYFAPITEFSVLL